MAIIQRKSKHTGKVSFQVRIKDRNGKWYPSPTFKRLEDAMAEKLRLLRLKRQGGQVIDVGARTITLAEYWSVWSSENRTRTSEGWKISQNQMYRDYVQPTLGQVPMIDIGAPEIGRVLNRMRERGLSEQTCLHVYTLMHQMFRDAVEYYEMLPASPVKRRFHRPKVSTKKRSFLHPEKAWLLLDHVEDSYLGPPVWLQTLSALRVSEVQALRWKSVQFDLNQILICAAFNNKTSQLQDYPKQEDWAYVPMIPKLKQYLERIRGDRGPEDFVCQGPRGGMLAYETYYRAVLRSCSLAGVDRVTTHELRHSCTEIWIQAGASAEDIRRLLNHASLEVTKTYIHRTDDRLSTLAASISRPALRVIEGG